MSQFQVMFVEPETRIDRRNLTRGEAELALRKLMVFAPWFFGSHDATVYVAGGTWYDRVLTLEELGQLRERIS